MEGRVRALLADQRWREAVEESARFVEARPDDRSIVTVRAEALFRAGLLDQVEELLRPLGRDGAAPARARMLLGRLREAQGRAGDAIAWMAAAVEADPEDREILYWASGSTASRAEALDLLRRYLARSAGDDPDRIEAARGSIDFYEQLGERPIWVSEDRPQRLEIPLQPLWDPYAGQVLGFLVDVRLGSKKKPVPMLLDSGSPGLFVIERAARKRGFQPLVEKTVFGGGGERRHQTRRGLFDSVAIGQLAFTSALATTSKVEMDPTGRYQGLLGLAAFNGYEVTVDFAERRLTLATRAKPVTGGSPYWTVLGQLLVQVELGPELRGLFLLDSGATRSVVSTPWAERLPGARLGSPVRLQGFGGGLQGARALDGVELRFLGQATQRRGLRAVDLSVRSRLAGVEIAGFLGLDFLLRQPLVIDSARRTVRLLPAHGE
jgi:hypothetical protein